MVTVMKLTYAALCFALLTASAAATEPVPSVATHPIPPTSTHCPPASATQPPPAAASMPAPRRAPDSAESPRQNDDEKLIPGRPFRPKPQPLPPPPCR